MSQMPPTSTPDTATQPLSALLDARYSCRAYRPDAVPQATIEAILRVAQRTPSWCNSQPWHITLTQPPATDRLRQALYARAAAGTSDEGAGYDIAPPAEYRGVYRERRRECGFGLYDSVGIAHGDRAASAAQALENFRLFGAPHLALVTTDAALGSYGALDCGAWVNNFMLAARERGVASIAQAALAAHGPFLRRWFNIPDDRHVVCGVSFGFEDLAHPANRYRTTRAPMAEVVRWIDE